MEEVAEATKAAIDSCHRVLSHLCLPNYQAQFRNLIVETEEAVFKFQRVVSLLGSGLSHGRVRKFRNLETALPESIFLDSPHSRTIISPEPLQVVIPSNCVQTQIRETNSKPNSRQVIQKMFFENPVLDMKSAINLPLQIAQSNSIQCHQFLEQHHHHHQQIKTVNFQQQQIKFQAETTSRTDSGICLTFDGSCQTPNMSSTRSFISSLSIDGSEANLDDNSLYLFGVTQLSDHISKEQTWRCSGRGEGGSMSMKCGSSKCHCTKRRSDWKSWDPQFGVRFLF